MSHPEGNWEADGIMQTESDKTLIRSTVQSRASKEVHSIGFSEGIWGLGMWNIWHDF